jgi:hypothetical protein
MLGIAAVVTFVLTTVFSMAGVGAAFVLIPVFLALGVELHSAMATALLLNAIAMSIASFTFIRKGLVEWRMVVPMLLIAVIASPIGVRVGGGLDRKLLLWLFVAFLLFACSMMLFYRPKPRPMGGLDEERPDARAASRCGSRLHRRLVGGWWRQHHCPGAGSGWP